MTKQTIIAGSITALLLLANIAVANMAVANNSAAAKAAPVAVNSAGCGPSKTAEAQRAKRINSMKQRLRRMKGR